MVYQDVIIGEGLTQVIDILRDTLPGAPLSVVVLCPSAEVAAARDAARAKTGYSEVFSAKRFDRVFMSETPRLGSGSTPGN